MNSDEFSPLEVEQIKQMQNAEWEQNDRASTSSYGNGNGVKFGHGVKRGSSIDILPERRKVTRNTYMDI